MSNIPNYELWSYQPTPFAPKPQAQRPASHRPEQQPRLAPQPFARLNRAAFANLSPIDQILFQHFGVGRASAPAYDTMHEAFTAQAIALPGAIAAEHLGQQISYGELNHQAERLAAHLATLGVQPGDNVALFLQRSIPMVVGIMAILKAGAAYVPQHAGVAPEAQLRHILAVANIRVVLTLSHLQETVPCPDGCLLLCIDEFMATADGESAGPFSPARPAHRDDNCFILFTSGTT
ncbi:MAG: AMP-binding protein, partial [Anaerolineales bacterium]|nr:AMP-binding protein [Anaerolineales bacterium]